MQALACNSVITDASSPPRGLPRCRDNRIASLRVHIEVTFPNYRASTNKYCTVIPLLLATYTWNFVDELEYNSLHHLHMPLCAAAASPTKRQSESRPWAYTETEDRVNNFRTINLCHSSFAHAPSPSVADDDTIRRQLSSDRHFKYSTVHSFRCYQQRPRGVLSRVDSRRWRTSNKRMCGRKVTCIFNTHRRICGIIWFQQHRTHHSAKFNIAYIYMPRHTV